MADDPSLSLENSEGAGQQRRRRSSSVEPEPDPLAGSGFANLPECFAMRQENGFVQEHEPCYHVAADCFIGLGREASLSVEGDIVVTSLPPNESMEPLNRAAALAFVKWQSRLPASRTPIDIGDMAEAAQMLASDPEVLKLNRVDWQNAVARLASELKLRREGKDARELPPLGHNFVRGARASPAPLLNSKLSEMSQRLPGETRFASAVPEYGPGAQTRRLVPQPFTPPSK